MFIEGAQKLGFRLRLRWRGQGEVVGGWGDVSHEDLPKRIKQPYPPVVRSSLLITKL